MWKCALGFAAALCAAASVSAQTPAGGEFQLNTYTPDYQIDPFSAAWDRGFVVVWRSRQDGSDFGAAGRLFAPDGTPRGPDFLINTYTTGPQEFVDVAADARGNFVTVWESEGRDGSGKGIAGRLFDAAGTPRGPEFLVNTYTTGRQGYPSVASAPGGSFVVVWNSDGQDGNQMGVFGQRFDRTGTALGVEFRVNTTTSGWQATHYPDAVTMDAEGRFVVVWQDAPQPFLTPTAVWGRRFAADGTPLSGAFQVNTPPYPPFALPSVAASRSGEFVVSWDNRGEVYARRYDAAGGPAGSGFQVSTTPLTYQLSRPRPAFDGVGNFVIVWRSGNDAIVRRFDDAGNPRGGEVVVNTVPFVGSGPGVASDSAGNLLVSFNRRVPGAGDDSFARRLGGLTPAALAVDTAGNRVLEPGETVDVRPSWRNISAAAQTFGGGLSAITGPPGAVYAITDAAADYGTAANGATQACADCYAVSVSNPPARPAVHWDASAVETITPDALGQAKRWRLHVGDSFTDVPRTSPFYRFVETLLHHEVTGGCAGGTYCPTSATSREQMAVFMLVAKEGAGYAPPACAPPNLFGDVPETSVFCPWIEELANRSVVGGCFPGVYCPTRETTRGEMAVFVLRTLEPALVPPACVPPNLYGDVPETNVFCRWIEDLTGRGVVTGCGGGNYCPSAFVLREEMSVFITATFGLALYGP